MFKALNYWVFGGFDNQKTPQEFIDYAAQKGLDGVELCGLSLPQAECEKIAAYAAAKNIRIRTITGTAGWAKPIATPDEALRRSAIEATKCDLLTAKWLGAETILLVPGATRVAWEPDRPVYSYKTVWEMATKSLKELAPAAEAAGVNIAVENVWNRFLLSPMEWKFFLDQFDSERIGLYFDVGNACLNGRPQDYPEILGKRIKAVHLKNFEETDCAGGLHGFGDDLFKGVVDYKAVFAAFDKIGYTGPYTVEMIPFSRLPDMVLPDPALADKVTGQLLSL